jgi:hypothetical protein
VGILAKSCPECKVELALQPEETDYGKKDENTRTEKILSVDNRGAPKSSPVSL